MVNGIISIVLLLLAHKHLLLLVLLAPLVKIVGILIGMAMVIQTKTPTETVEWIISIVLAHKVLLVGRVLLVLLVQRRQRAPQAHKVQRLPLVPQAQQAHKVLLV